MAFRHNLAELAAWSEAAYEPDEDPRSSAFPDATAHLVRDEDAEVLLVKSLSGRIAAVRGTQVTAGWSWTDVRANMHAALVPYGYRRGRAHAGYLEYARIIEPHVRAFFSDVNGTDDFWITGHSLGGATATVLGLLLADMPIDIRVVTFGAPRALDSHAARNYPWSLTRVVNGNDIAPKYPFPWLGYRHAGQFWKLHSDGRLTQPRWSYCSDQLILPMTWHGVTAGVLDHRVHLYATRLESEA